MHSIKNKNPFSDTNRRQVPSYRREVFVYFFGGKSTRLKKEKKSELGACLGESPVLKLSIRNQFYFFKKFFYGKWLENMRRSMFEFFELNKIGLANFESNYRKT